MNLNTRLNISLFVSKLKVWLILLKKERIFENMVTLLELRLCKTYTSF